MLSKTQVLFWPRYKGDQFHEDVSSEDEVSSEDKVGLTEDCESLDEGVGENFQDYEFPSFHDIFRFHMDICNLACWHAALFDGLDRFIDPRGPRGWGRLDEDLD